MKLSKGTGLILLGVSLVVIDQIIKVLVKTNMSLGEQIPLIGEWCRLCFVENEGMAFGLSFGEGIGKLLLSLFRIGLSAFLIWWISSLLRKEKTPLGVLVGLTMITAGAIGNIIDCLFYGLIWDYAPFMFGRVVDMFYFPIIRDGARVIFSVSDIENIAKFTNSDNPSTITDWYNAKPGSADSYSAHLPAGWVYNDTDGYYYYNEPIAPGEIHPH